MISDPTERFAIVPISTPGRTPDDALVVGPLSEVTEYIGQSVARQDAIAGLNHARFSVDQIASMQNKTRAVQAAMLADTIKQLDARLNALAHRRSDSALARKRRDEEEEQKRIKAELDALPDPDDPDPLPLRSKEPEPSSPPQEDQPEYPNPDQPEGTSMPQPTAVGLDNRL